MQCGISSSKGNKIIGLIRRNITYKYRKKDIEKLERIKRRSAKMSPELRELSYESRLLQCGLTTLETRRLRGDQIEVFTIVNGYEDVKLRNSVGWT